MKSEKERRKEVDALLHRVGSERRELMRSLNRRSRRKPLEEDGRRKSGLTDAAFWHRYRELGTQVKLAAELGTSRQAVGKRVRRIAKEKMKSAQKAIAAIRWALGDI